MWMRSLKECLNLNEYIYSPIVTTYQKPILELERKNTRITLKKKKKKITGEATQEGKKRGLQNNQNISSKMAINTYLLIITLNVNVLEVANNRCFWGRWKIILPANCKCKWKEGWDSNVDISQSILKTKFVRKDKILYNDKRISTSRRHNLFIKYICKSNYIYKENINMHDGKNDYNTII